MAWKNILLLLTRSITQIKENMSGIGILLFLIFGGMAFWMLLFTLGFAVPFWISLGIFEKIRPKRVFDEEDEN